MAAENTTHKIKILCSYGGKILPRPSDGRLRYFGGLTRVISVRRCVSLSELMANLENLCGYSVKLRCQLPNEDLDILISIKSNEDLDNIIQEYHKFSLISGKDLKIRAILSTAKSSSTSSSSSSTSSSSSSVDNLSHLISGRYKFTSQKPALTANVGNILARKRCQQYGVVHYYYPCRFEANCQPFSYFVQHSNRTH